MIKSIISFIFISLILIQGCGTPNDPESILGGDGGYKIISKTATSAYAQDVVIKDTMLYVAQGEGSLVVIDNKNPANPSIITVYTHDQYRGYSYKLAMKDTIIYIATGLFGITTINVADPRNPNFEGNNRNIKPAKDFCIFNGFLFTALSEEGVSIADISSYPSQPEIRGGMVTPGYAQSITVSSDSNYALVAIGELGLAFYDISELQNGYGIYPLIKVVDLDGYAENVTINPDMPVAYVACGTGGLAVIDFSDSSSIKLAGKFDTGGYAKEVCYQNNKIFITTELRGLQIIDVSNPNYPVRIGSVQTPFAKGVAADSKHIYVADEDEGLIVISIPN